MNIIESVTARIEEYRTENKNPCKNYATEIAAEKATAKMAQQAAIHFSREQDINARPAQYVVFYNKAWGRWVGAINLIELMQRSTSTGGYLGFCTGFYTF